MIVITMIKMLEGGNTFVQKSIYEFFINDQNSEKFFELFYNILNNEVINPDLSVSSIYN